MGRLPRMRKDAEVAGVGPPPGTGFVIVTVTGCTVNASSAAASVAGNAGERGICDTSCSTRAKLRRYAALLPLVLLLITGAALAGCIGGKSGTPAGPAQLTITATSGTLSQTTNVTLAVN